MQKKFSLLVSFILIITVTQWIQIGQAQSLNISYSIQVGDTLGRIAQKYDLPLTTIAQFNNIANPDLILPGQRLIIPTEAEINEMAAQANLTYTVQSGDTLFEIANKFGIRVNQLVEANQITNVDLIEVGQLLVIPTSIPVNQNLPLPYPFEAIEFSNNNIAQGQTLVVSITLATDSVLSADFEDRPIFLTGDGRRYWGIVGIHALSELGLYSVQFQAILPDGTQSKVVKGIYVQEGGYNTETIQVIPGREGLLEPEVVQAEITKLNAIWRQVSSDKHWTGKFLYPVTEIRITSPFGTRRSYGGGPVNGFHGGSDFGGGTGTPIYAPAAGTVVLAETLTVRGNAVLIDHGLGLFSGYWHQSELAVQVGDEIEPGDLIGYIGDTGLVTGPHLHWEMRLGGIAIDPLQWIQQTIP